MIVYAHPQQMHRPRAVGCIPRMEVAHDQREERVAQGVKGVAVHVLPVRISVEVVARPGEPGSEVARAGPGVGKAHIVGDVGPGAAVELLALVVARLRAADVARPEVRGAAGGKRGRVRLVPGVRDTVEWGGVVGWGEPVEVVLVAARRHLALVHDAEGARRQVVLRGRHQRRDRVGDRRRLAVPHAGDVAAVPQVRPRRALPAAPHGPAADRRAEREELHQKSRWGAPKHTVGTRRARGLNHPATPRGLPPRVAIDAIRSDPRLRVRTQ